MDLVLLITLYRVNEDRGEKNKYEVCGYMIQKINEIDGKIIYGNFINYLYKPTKKHPNPTVNLQNFEKVKTNKLEQGLVSFSIQEPSYNLEDEYDGAFIPNPEPQYDLQKDVWDDEKNFDARVGIDIFIE